MAIMMISVTERTREIGVRKALGAKRRDILWQFLLEAVFLTALGGLLGVVLGSGVGLIVHWATQFPVSLPWWSFAIGLGFSATVGIFFGMYPAFKAARLDPIEALRYELVFLGSRRNSDVDLGLYSRSPSTVSVSRRPLRIVLRSVLLEHVHEVPS